jgi:hypothetical protein
VVHRFTRGCRPSGAIEISGRRHEEAAVFGELAHYCGAVGGRTDPDRNIQTLADEVDQPVIEFQRDGKTGLTYGELPQYGRYATATEGDRSTDPQGACRLVAAA